VVSHISNNQYKNNYRNNNNNQHNNPAQSKSYNYSKTTIELVE